MRCLGFGFGDASDCNDFALCKWNAVDNLCEFESVDEIIEDKLNELRAKRGHKSHGFEVVRGCIPDALLNVCRRNLNSKRHCYPYAHTLVACAMTIMSL